MTSTASTIKSARKAAGLTQQKLADLMGVHVASVRSWEKEKGSMPGSRLAQKLAEVLGIETIPLDKAVMEPMMELEIAEIMKGLHKKIALVHGLTEDKIEISIRILS